MDDQNSPLPEDPLAAGAGSDYYADMGTDYPAAQENKGGGNGTILLVAVAFVLLALVVLVIVLVLPNKGNNQQTAESTPTSTPVMIATPSAVVTQEPPTPTEEEKEKEPEEQPQPSATPTPIKLKKIVIKQKSTVSSTPTTIPTPKKPSHKGFVFDPNANYRSCENNQFCHDNLCSECNGGFCGKPPGFKEYVCLTNGRVKTTVKK